MEYEKDKIREKLETDAMTLDSTRTWFKESRRRLVGDHMGLIEQVAQGNAATLVKEHGSALMDLIENTKLAVPETLELDTHRLMTMLVQ
jgi:hypothetical protein